MAKKEKTSFFGKIMGGNIVDDTDDVDLNPEEEIKNSEPEELKTQDDEIAEDVTVYEEEMVYTKPEITQTVKEEQKIEVEQKSSEEWMSEYEGQLNIDMYQTRDNVIIKSTIAGVKPEDIDITIANDMVTIKGMRKQEEKIPQDDFFYQECYWGGFSRSLIVPIDIDSEHIEADLRDGILTIIIPKAAKAKTKKVKVKGF